MGSMQRRRAAWPGPAGRAAFGVRGMRVCVSAWCKWRGVNARMRHRVGKWRKWRNDGAMARHKKRNAWGRFSKRSSLEATEAAIAATAKRWKRDYGVTLELGEKNGESLDGQHFEGYGPVPKVRPGAGGGSGSFGGGVGVRKFARLLRDSVVGVQPWD